jgi:type I restriction enzyme S subunit
LDAADALCKKTRQLMDGYEELAQSIFMDMFGDPVRNPKGWKKNKLEDVCIKITDGTHFSPEPQSKGFPYVTAKHVKSY